MNPDDFEKYLNRAYGKNSVLRDGLTFRVMLTDNDPMGAQLEQQRNNIYLKIKNGGCALCAANNIIEKTGGENYMDMLQSTEKEAIRLASQTINTLHQKNENDLIDFYDHIKQAYGEDAVFDTTYFFRVMLSDNNPELRRAEQQRKNIYIKMNDHIGKICVSNHLLERIEGESCLEILEATEDKAADLAHQIITSIDERYEHDARRS